MENIKLPKVKKQKISVNLVKRTYKITDGRFTIFASVSNENKLTLKTVNKNIEFIFKNSKADIAESIIKLMSEATKLLKSEAK
jgi:hypothetical protein